MHDIVSTSEFNAGKTYIVTGFFTPDYRGLTEALADQLAAVGAPFHFFAWDKHPAGWDTSPKPTVVLAAIDRYPGKTVILMDVDCAVRGDLAPLTELPGDVGLTIRARPQMKWRSPQAQQVVVLASSRVVVFRPFAGAVAFAQEWQRLCSVVRTSAYRGDEGALIWAYLNCPWVSYYQITPEYSAAGEPGSVPGAIIEHDSAHNKERAMTWRGRLKNFEKRWIRTGRTRRATKQIPTRHL
jgi:hypothetical protein